MAACCSAAGASVSAAESKVAPPRPNDQLPIPGGCFQSESFQQERERGRRQIIVAVIRPAPKIQWSNQTKL